MRFVNGKIDKGYFFLIFYYFKRSVIKATAKNTLKNRSYGKKSGSYGKKVRFNIEVTEKK